MLSPIVRTSSGPVSGTSVAGIHRYAGIPYAAAPVGALRFAAPAPPGRWEAPRPATGFGPTAPAPPIPEGVSPLLVSPRIAGEDWLTVNVWTPSVTDRLPVLVWIHGGAFVAGSSAQPVSDGAAFARDGLVFVSLNYRVGADGFLHLPGYPDNRGLLDQLAGLHWVRDNIAAFGGDPDRVTMMGESAGAMSVTTLLASPRTGGLVHGMIAQSGAGHHVITARTAQTVTVALAGRLGIAPTAAAFAAVPITELYAAQGALSQQIALDPAGFDEIRHNAMDFEPVIDGDLVPGRPIDAIAAGAGADVPVLTGTCADEFALFLAPTGMLAGAGSAQLAEATDRIGATDLVPAYQRLNPAATPGQLWAAILGDWTFGVPAVRLAEARADAPAATYMYEFDWPSSALAGLGACHGLDLPFAFDTLRSERIERFTGPAAPQWLADEMHGALVRFASTGNPGWAAYRPERTVRLFGTGVGSGLHSHRRLLWDGRR